MSNMGEQQPVCRWLRLLPVGSRVKYCTRNPNTHTSDEWHTGRISMVEPTPSIAYEIIPDWRRSGNPNETVTIADPSNSSIQDLSTNGWVHHFCNRFDHLLSCGDIMHVSTRSCQLVVNGIECFYPNDELTDEMAIRMGESMQQHDGNGITDLTLYGQSTANLSPAAFESFLQGIASCVNIQKVTFRTFGIQQQQQDRAASVLNVFSRNKHKSLTSVEFCASALSALSGLHGKEDLLKSMDLILLAVRDNDASHLDRFVQETGHLHGLVAYEPPDTYSIGLPVSYLTYLPELLLPPSAFTKAVSQCRGLNTLTFRCGKNSEAILQLYVAAMEKQQAAAAAATNSSGQAVRVLKLKAFNSGPSVEYWETSEDAQFLAGQFQRLPHVRHLDLSEVFMPRNDTVLDLVWNSGLRQGRRRNSSLERLLWNDRYTSQRKKDEVTFVYWKNRLQRHFPRLQEKGRSKNGDNTMRSLLTQVLLGSSLTRPSRVFYLLRTYPFRKYLVLTDENRASIVGSKKRTAAVL